MFACVAALIIEASAGAADAADLTFKAPQAPVPYDWSGFYAGGHLGYAWGTSNWTTAPNLAGSLDLYQPFDLFTNTGSYFAGLQAGYNYVLPNRFVVGAEADASFPGWPNFGGTSIGGTSMFPSPIGPESYSETVLSSGTVRGRIGYAPGNWLLYVTGGFAWTYDQLTLTQLATGTPDSPFLWRLGWAAGAGVEVPVAPHWTASIQYLYTDYGHSNVLFANTGQRFDSDFLVQELRAGLNYHFGSDAMPANMLVKASETPDSDLINFHGQTTLLEQAYPAFRSPYEGAQSLPGAGQGRETWDATLYAGVRLWQGAELWINPEIDQGFGLDSTLGVAGFPSAEAYKLGADYPYTRISTGVRPTDDQSRRRSPEGGCRRQPIRRKPDGQPACLYNRQIQCRRYLRQQQIRARPAQRLHELGHRGHGNVRLRR